MSIFSTRFSMMLSLAVLVMPRNLHAIRDNEGDEMSKGSIPSTIVPQWDHRKFQALSRSRDGHTATSGRSEPFDVPKRFAGCRVVDDTSAACDDIQLGHGVCNLEALKCIGQNASKNPVMTSLFWECVRPIRNLVPFDKAYERLSALGPRQMKPFLAVPFDDEFTGLTLVDPRGLWVMDNVISPEEILAMRASIPQIPRRQQSFYIQPDESQKVAQGECDLGSGEIRDLVGNALFKPFQDRMLARLGKPSNTPLEYWAHTYRPGGFISNHYDVGPCERDTFQNPNGDKLPPMASCNDPARRHVTILIFLTDVPDGAGGATYFPDISQRVQAKAGRMILFFPTYLDRTTNPFLSHRGEDTHVTKEILQLFVGHGSL